MKNIFFSWFTVANYIAQDYKAWIGKNISISVNISDYEEVDSWKTTTFIAGISCNKNGIKDLKIDDIMTKLMDKKII